MIKYLWAAIFATSCLVSGCATVKLTESNTTIVMASKVKKGEGVSGISNKFSFEGRIYAHLTFKWSPSDNRAGFKDIQAKWFSGDKELKTTDYKVDLGTSPHYVWFSTSGTALGTGKAHVEIFVDGAFVGRKDFEVVEKL